MMCTVTLSQPIGPDYSSLVVLWESSFNMTYDCTTLQSLANTQLSNLFVCNLTLNSISKDDSGQYKCTSYITGTEQTNSDSVNLTVLGLF